MIDLHMHSIYSDDGEYTPTELVKLCAANKISVMSVTDHNCVRGNAEASETAKAYGIKYITGIEIDCTFKGVNFHMLGYGIDCSDERFAAIEDNIDKQSCRASHELLEKTRKLGFEITESEMLSAAAEMKKQYHWTGEMFGEVLLTKPEYMSHPLLAPYRVGGRRSDNPFVNFYWDYYSQGKPCYVQIEYPEMSEILGLIHDSGGIAVLAHPGANLKKNTMLLEKIIKLGTDGIEAFSSYHTIERTTSFLIKALNFDLLITCGSDFHGKTKPAIHIGDTSLTPEETEVKANEIVRDYLVKSGLIKLGGSLNAAI